MADNILFTLVDQYGNSLENFSIALDYNFEYVYARSTESVLRGSSSVGIVLGTLPKPKPDLQSTILTIQTESEFYYAPAPLEYKGKFTAPQKIVVAKKTLDPKEKNDILKNATEELRQAIQERVNPTSQDIEEPKINL